ncbi:hypothetical protein B566_EDAN017417 [Ephemera danica]|nr:hypothetical protein B566_EDAN017417 [Ephemera danica]
MLDCATVCRLLRSGMKLCCLRMDSCISLIAKHCTSTFLNSALNLYPSAINWRGSRGATLLMMCKTPENFQTVLDHGADVKATNLDYENVLLYNVKYRPGQVKDIFYRVYRAWSQEKDMENLEEKWKDLLRLILNSGVDLDAEDKEGQTAFQLLLKMFKPGYVFHPDHREKLSHNTLTLMCLHGSKIASSFLSVFLEAGVKLPPPDQHGRTPLMLAVQCPLNFENMRTMIERGVDINAVDLNGNNAIYHLLASVHEHIEFAGNECEIDFLVVDQMVSFLLDHGCHMQGTDFLMSEYKDDCVKFKIVNYLMALGGSTLKERDFSLKLEAKNDSINLSFLSLYLMARVVDEFPLFDLSDVAYIKQEIADGLDVNCGDHHSEVHKVPSLLQLSRTALRSSLKKTDTKGLDVSSLRALCEGEVRPLPPDIVDLINFMKSSTMAGSFLHKVDVPTKKATFAMGCFWAPDSLFGVTKGVIRTRVGYTGGTKEGPTYKSL